MHEHQGIKHSNLRFSRSTYPVGFATLHITLRSNRRLFNAGGILMRKACALRPSAVMDAVRVPVTIAAPG